MYIFTIPAKAIQPSAVFPDPTSAEAAPVANGAEPHLVSSGSTASVSDYRSISA